MQQHTKMLTDDDHINRRSIPALNMEALSADIYCPFCGAGLSLVSAQFHVEQCDRAKNGAVQAALAHVLMGSPSTPLYSQVAMHTARSSDLEQSGFFGSHSPPLSARTPPMVTAGNLHEAINPRTPRGRSPPRPSFSSLAKKVEAATRVDFSHHRNFMPCHRKNVEKRAGEDPEPHCTCCPTPYPLKTSPKGNTPHRKRSHSLPGSLRSPHQIPDWTGRGIAYSEDFSDPKLKTPPTRSRARTASYSDGSLPLQTPPSGKTRTPRSGPSNLLEGVVEPSRQVSMTGISKAKTLISRLSSLVDTKLAEIIESCTGEWQQTKKLIEEIPITQPSMKEKYLRKPPFRFIHDLISEITDVTGFAEGLYTQEEMHQRTYSNGNRVAKVAYLDKIIRLVEFQLNLEVEANPSQIILYHKPENTNRLLQLIAVAAMYHADSAENVEKVLAGMKLGDEVHNYDNMEELDLDVPKRASTTNTLLNSNKKAVDKWKRAAQVNRLSSTFAPTPSPSLKYSVLLKKDETVPVGTQFHPGQIFTKSWRLLNDGQVPLPEGCSVVQSEGPKLSHDEKQISSKGPGEEFTVSLEIKAPQEPQRYTSAWTLQTPDGVCFGQKLWLDMVVSK